MATSIGKACCVICSKEKATLKCGGCSEDFCYNHWELHRQQLYKQLDEVEVNRDLFRQALTQNLEQPNNHTLIQQVNKWEQNSIKTIQQTAEETRQIILKTANGHMHQLEIKLNKLTNQLREGREENDFNEIHLRQFEEELKRLTEQLTKPSNITIQEISTGYIDKIFVNISTNDTPSSTKELTFKCNINHNTRWVQNGVTVAGGNGEGDGLNQLNSPISLYVDNDQTIYVVDCGNHRIMQWKCGASSGKILAGGNGQGNKINQLHFPRDVIVYKKKENIIVCDRQNTRVVRWSIRQNDRSPPTIISNGNCNRVAIDIDGYIYVSDFVKHEVRRWKSRDTDGILVAGGNGKGDALNQLNEPGFIFVDEEYSVYISDYKNNRVMKWTKGAKEGIIVAGGQGAGDSLRQLSAPAGVFADHLGTVYVADSDNNRIIRWYKGAKAGNIVVGGNGKGQEANQLNSPGDLSFDGEGNLYIADFHNHRVQKFNIDRS